MMPSPKWPPNIVISNGTITQNFGEHGNLFGTTSGDGSASGQGTATFVIDLVITGGTGLFLGASGEGRITGTITQTGPTTESVSASYTESFTAPEPSTWVLLVAGVAGLGLRRLRIR